MYVYECKILPKVDNRPERLIVGLLFNQVFQWKTLVIKMMNKSRRARLLGEHQHIFSLADFEENVKVLS